MKTFFKRLAVSVAVIFLLLVSSVGILLWLAKSKTDDVRAMCAILPGTSIEQVMKRARELDFSEKSQGALGSGLVVFIENQDYPIQWKDDSLPEVQNGRIKVGKTSLPPFLRNYCEISIQNRKVISSRTWTLD